MFLALCLRRSGTTDSRAFYPGSFGFVENGTWELDVTFSEKNLPKNVTLYLMTKSELKSQVNVDITNGYCKAIYSDINYSQVITQKTYRFEGVSAKKQVLYFLFMQCDSMAKLDFSIRFKNVDTFLDTRAIPCKITYPISFSIASVILIYWVIQHFRSNSIKTVFFWITFTAVAVYDAHLIAEYSALLVQDKRDSGSGAEIFSIIVDVLNNAILVSTVMIVSTGYGFIDVQFGWKTIIQIVVLPLALFTLAAISTRNSIVGIIILLALLGIAVYMCYVLYKNINEAEKKVMAHMLLVSRRGIDPESTPLNDRLNVYKHMMYYITAAAAGFFISMILGSAIDIAAYAYEIVDFLIHMPLLIWFMYLYRPVGYSINDVDVDGDQEVINLDELDDIGITLSTIHKDRVRKWEPGMPLPREPKFVKTRKFSTTNYTSIEDNI